MRKPVSIKDEVTVLKNILKFNEVIIANLVEMFDRDTLPSDDEFKLLEQQITDTTKDAKKVLKRLNKTMNPVLPK